MGSQVDRPGLFLGVVVLSMAVVAPGFGASSRKAVGCMGPLSTGGSSSCATTFRIPHYNGHDSIDYRSLVARIVSPQATSWRVWGSLTDGRGVAYFSWSCSAGRSSVAMRSETYVERSCQATRKTVPARRHGRAYMSYYVADTSKPQRLNVWAVVGACAPSCQFEGAATYVIAG